MKTLLLFVGVIAGLAIASSAYPGDYEDYVYNSGAGPVSESYYNEHIATTPVIPMYQPAQNIPAYNPPAYVSCHPALMGIDPGYSMDYAKVNITPTITPPIPTYDTYVNSGNYTFGPVSRTGYQDTMNTFARTASIQSFDTQAFTRTAQQTSDMRAFTDSMQAFTNPATAAFGFNDIFTSQSFAAQSFNTQDFTRPMTATVETPGLLNSFSEFVGNIFSPANAHAWEKNYSTGTGRSIILDENFNIPGSSQPKSYNSTPHDSIDDRINRLDLRDEVISARRDFLIDLGIKSPEALKQTTLWSWELPCDLIDPPCLDNYKPMDLDKIMKMENIYRRDNNMPPLKINSINSPGLDLFDTPVFSEPVPTASTLGGMYDTATEFLGDLFSPATNAHAWGRSDYFEGPCTVGPITPSLDNPIFSSLLKPTPEPIKPIDNIKDRRLGITGPKTPTVETGRPFSDFKKQYDLDFMAAYDCWSSNRLGSKNALKEFKNHYNDWNGATPSYNLPLYEETFQKVYPDVPISNFYSTIPDRINY
jgi:hypothetical protein